MTFSHFGSKKKRAEVLIQFFDLGGGSYCMHGGTARLIRPHFSASAKGYIEKCNGRRCRIYASCEHLLFSTRIFSKF